MNAKSQNQAVGVLQVSASEKRALIKQAMEVAAQLHQNGKLKEALEFYSEVLNLEPENPDALHLLGALCIQMGMYDVAVKRIRQAIRLNPKAALYYANLGLALRKRSEWKDAETACRKALRLQPTLAEAYNNLGDVLEAQGKYDEALTAFRRAVRYKPDYPDGLNNLANRLKELGHLEESITYYDQAIALKPNHPDPHWNRSTALLTLGDLAGGWEGYDYGFASGARKPNRQFLTPRWQGEDISDKRLLVWREQGVGDEILFASCYPDIIKRSGHCIIECEPRLVSLFARSFPQATVRSQTVNGSGQEQINPPDFNVQVPAGSLLRYLRSNQDSFPRHNGYLILDPQLVAFWRERLQSLGEGIKVGICWRSGLINHSRIRHYTRLDEWGPIFSVPGVQFINLQYGQCEEELVDAEKRFGVQIHRWEDLNLKDDFEGTAALIAGLDLVVTAGTSVSVLAGAQAIPTWRYGVKPNWTTLGSDHYPWLPSVRLFDKSWKDPWEVTMNQIGRELAIRTEAANAK